MRVLKMGVFWMLFFSSFYLNLIYIYIYIYIYILWNCKAYKFNTLIKNVIKYIQSHNVLPWTTKPIILFMNKYASHGCLDGITFCWDTTIWISGIWGCKKKKKKKKKKIAFKGVLLCFFPFCILVKCVVSMFGHITSYKVTKSTPKRDISFKKNPFKKNYNERLVWTTKLFSSICKWKFGWLAGGEKAWLSTARFKIETQCRCFYITVSNGNQLFSENVGCHFNFILHIMSDKAVFVSRSLFCALPGKHRALALQQRPDN